MNIKLYIVTTPDDRFISAKLTREAAQSVARIYAPAKVQVYMADKLRLDLGEARTYPAPAPPY